MKITEKNYNIIKQAMKKELATLTKTAKEANYPSTGFTKETFLDVHTNNKLGNIKNPVFYAANLLLKFSTIDGYPTPSHFICDVIYNENKCNDTHLKTALVKIWGEL